MCGYEGGVVVAVGVFSFNVGEWLRWRGCVWLRWWCGGCGEEGVCGCDGGAVVVVKRVCAAAMMVWLLGRECVQL